jgi:DNA-directed RNA polymerase specialized sigma subunit
MFSQDDNAESKHMNDPLQTEDQYEEVQSDYGVKSDRILKQNTAAASRKISSSKLLDIHQEHFPIDPASAEAALPQKILKIGRLSADEEKEMVNRWKDEGCIKSRNTAILSIIFRQLSYLMKKKNVGDDLMDMVQEAAIEAIWRLDSPSIGLNEKYQTTGLLAALHARTHRRLTMSRQVAARVGGEHKKAMTALLRFEFEDLKSGSITADVACRGRDVLLEPIQDILSYITEEDVEFGDVVGEEVPSHEDKIIMRCDMRQLAPALIHALDERAREIIIRRKLLDHPHDAVVVGKDLKISQERVRQIERQAILDLRAWFEGKHTIADVQRQKEELRQRQERSKPKFRRLSRRSIKGVDLVAARRSMPKMLDNREFTVIKARYFSSDRIPTFREIEPEIGLSNGAMSKIETSAVNKLRKRFPASSPQR